MIKFDKLWKTMEDKGISTYYLRKKTGIDSKTIRRLKANETQKQKLSINYVLPLIADLRISQNIQINNSHPMLSNKASVLFL